MKKGYVTMKNFISEFKKFISKGDVMSMAVGIIIGGAFTAIINSLVSDIIGPVIGMICGGIDFSALSVKVGDAQLMIGNFIQAVINFLLVALVLFVIMRSFNRMKEKMVKEKEEEPAPEEPSEEVKLLTEIRDSLAK